MRTLSYILLTAALLTALAFGSIAQDNRNGLYKTGADFAENRLTDPEATNDQNRIEAYRGVLKVYRQGKPTTYKSGSVYGYHQNGVTYRAMTGRTWFAENGYCQVVGAGALVIYAKQSTHHRSNGRVWYYYSIGMDGKIRRLTKQNLTKDFTYQPEFLSAAQAKLNKHDLKEALAISELYAKFK